MGKRKEKKQGTYEEEQKKDFSDPWLGKKTGLIVIAILSVALVIFLAFTFIPALGLAEGLLWSLGFGATIWIIFGGYYAFNKFVRKL